MQFWLQQSKISALLSVYVCVWEHGHNGVRGSLTRSFFTVVGLLRSKKILFHERWHSHEIRKNKFCTKIWCLCSTVDRSVVLAMCGVQNIRILSAWGLTTCEAKKVEQKRRNVLSVVQRCVANSGCETTFHWHVLVCVCVSLTHSVTGSQITWHWFLLLIKGKLWNVFFGRNAAYGHVWLANACGGLSFFGIFWQILKTSIEVWAAVFQMKSVISNRQMTARTSCSKKDKMYLSNF